MSEAPCYCATVVLSRQVETPRPPSPTADSGAWMTLSICNQALLEVPVLYLGTASPNTHGALLEMKASILQPFLYVGMQPVQSFYLDSDAAAPASDLGRRAGLLVAVMRMQHGVPPVGGLAPSVASL